MLPVLPPLLQAEVDAGTINLENTTVPAFVNLHRRLTTQCLDHDVSTRSKNQEREDSGVAETLREHHVRRARVGVLVRALKEICLMNGDGDGGGDGADAAEILSSELKEFCYVVSVYLASIEDGSENVDGDAEELMAEEFALFERKMPLIVAAVEQYLNKLENTMVGMLEPLILSSPPSTSIEGRPLQPPVRKTSRIPSSSSAVYSTTATARTSKSTATTTTRPSPPSNSSTLLATHTQSQTSLQQTTLPKLLTDLSTTLSALLSAQTQLLTSQIRHAELHIHSISSRHTLSQTTFLSTVAQGLSLKTQILGLQREKEAYAIEGVRDGLRRRYEELVREERALTEREESLRGLVGRYRNEGRGKGDGEEKGVGNVFERLGKGYREVEEEIEVVRRDVERLEAEVNGTGTGAGAGRMTGRSRGRR